MTVALTSKFAAMNGRDKWETLVLSGLIGTDEPWIAATTATLREEAAERQSLSDRIDVLEGEKAALRDDIVAILRGELPQASLTQGGNT